MSSRLVVLGSCGAWPESGRACSGFVLEYAGTRLILDLGYATLPRLLTVLGSGVAHGIDAVIVTHKHPDHMLDLHGLFRARWFGRREAPAIPLYSPEGVLARVAGLEEDDAAAVHRVFDWRPLPQGSYQVGPFRLDSVALPHFVLNAGVRLTAPGLTVAYTGDTGPDAALAELGRDADLYIVEATSRNQRAGTPESPTGPAMHLTDPGDVLCIGSEAAADDDSPLSSTCELASSRPLGEQRVGLRPIPGHRHLPGGGCAVQAVEPAGGIPRGQRSGRQPISMFVPASRRMPQDRRDEVLGAMDHQRRGTHPAESRADRIAASPARSSTVCGGAPADS